MTMITFIQTILTWIELASLAFCTAVLVFRLPFFMPSTPAAAYRSEIFHPGIWRLFGTGIAAIAASSIGGLLLRTGEMSGRALESVFPVLPTVILHTHYGTIWLIRMACLVLLSVFLPAQRTNRDSPSVRYLMLALAVVVAWTESASGHPSDRGDFSLREMADTVHLLAASVWGGGVLVLSLVILPFLTKQGEITSVAEVSSRFSRIAGYAVAAVLLTALYNARAYVGSLEALWKTPYGLTVIVKMVLFYFLLLIGAFNRYVSVPLLKHVSGSAYELPGALERIVRGLFGRFRVFLTAPVVMLFGKILIVEAILMSSVLFCAAFLKHQTPASHLKHIEHEQRMDQTTVNTFIRLDVPKRHENVSSVSR